MIYFLKGTIIKINKTSIVLEVSNIAYIIYMCEKSLSSFNINENITIYTYSSFSMYEGQVLYGFKTEEEKEIFELLKNSIPNTGPKKALEYLNKILRSTNDFKKAIRNKDLKLLTSLFSFTSKTAEKLIHALKEKIENLTDIEDETSLKGEQYEKILNILISLGYKQNQAKEAMKESLKEIDLKNTPFEEIVKLCIKKSAQIL